MSICSKSTTNSTEKSKLHSQTTPTATYLNKSNPHTVCLNAIHTFLAINFSALYNITGYLTSFPSLSLSTFPSSAGDFRASAWA